MLKKTEQWRLDLLKAADVIRERGLAKHTLCDAKGGVCIRGAILVAMSATPAPFPLSWKMLDNINAEDFSQRDTAVRTYLGSQVPTNYWNNHPERTKEEVIAALEGAALAPVE